MKKLLENFWIKLFALLLGLLLWFHVATEKLYTYQLELPIKEIVLGNDLTLSNTPPESLQVTVLASGKQLLRKKWRERGLKITATQFNTGFQDLTLNRSNTALISPTADISLEEINFPPNIELNIDHIDSKEIPIESDLNIIADDGFSVNSVILMEPKTITITGPRRLIQKIPVVFTEKKDLTGLRNNLNLTLPLATPSGYNIQLEPDSVTVNIEVVPIKTRMFKNIPIVIFNKPPDKDIILMPGVVEVELTGPPAEIDIFNRSLLVASVDYKSLTEGADSLLVKVDCPPRFKIKDISTRSVKIKEN